MATRPRPLTAHRSRPDFVRRVAGFFLFGIGFVGVSLAVGVGGYHEFAGLSWVDSLLNASMILTGMGPVDPMTDDRSKIFASLYALYSGAAYPVVTALILYPFLHRMLAVMHLQAIETARQDGAE